MDIKYYFEETRLTQTQIAKLLGLTVGQVNKHVVKNYSKNFRKNRKTHSYRMSKYGNLNPMKGNFLEKHPRYIGDVSDHKGYLMRIKPSWFTGRKRSLYCFSHHVVVCENLGLTEIPKGWCVHHCDSVKTNNSFNNLVLMKISDHQRLHHQLEGATTISKESTLKWVETHGTPWSHDIVSSAWEHAAANSGQEVMNPVEDK